MTSEKKILAIEFTVIISLWTLAIVIPFVYIRQISSDLMDVYIIWAECTVIGFAYLVNRFLLMPYLFFERKYVYYVLCMLSLLVLLGVFIFYFDGVNVILAIFGLGDFGHPAPMFAPPSAPPPPHFAAAPNSVIPPTISVLVWSIVVMALDMGLSIATKWIISEQKQAKLSKERVAAQLANLQSQISPHFFMNTLNNIHALVDIDSVRAKQTIIELSGLMSYLLYDSSNHDKVSLQKELDFISNYVNLMRIRFSSQLKISFSHDELPLSVNIPPLLFLNFIENAFKYGVDYDKESSIDIHFSYDNNKVVMRVNNTNHSAIVKQSSHSLGIINARKRLDLIYGNDYSLEINQSEKQYTVNLQIPVI